MRGKLSRIKETKGFTLVEIIVVVVILAVLIGVSVGGYTKYIGMARRNVDAHNMDEITEMFETDYEMQENLWAEARANAEGMPATCTLSWTNSGNDSVTAVYTGNDLIKKHMQSSIDNNLGGKLPVLNSANKATVTIVCTKIGDMTVSYSLEF